MNTYGIILLATGIAGLAALWLTRDRHNAIKDRYHGESITTEEGE